jgi:DNA-directed RNA polymerase specialized sigma24 family protein
LDYEKIMTTSSNASEMPTSPDVSQEDCALLARVGLGDKKAMASLYDLHSKLVYSVALRVCHDSVTAEQIVQSVFMRVWLAPQQFASSQAGLDGRLGLISRNLAIDLMRERKSISSSDKPSLGLPFDPVNHTEVGLIWSDRVNSAQLWGCSCRCPCFCPFPKTERAAVGAVLSDD